MFENSKWLWLGEADKPNMRVNFKRTFNLNDIPEHAFLKTACETKYWLFINGKLAVYDGGLFRESEPGCGYYDEKDVAGNLIAGENEIVWHVWYFGNGGRNNVTCKKAGLLYECKELGLFSDKNTFAEIDGAYYSTAEENPSYLYGGHNVAYDARVKPFSLCPEFVSEYPADELGVYGDAPWGGLLKRCIPDLKFGSREKMCCERENGICKVKLPYAMQFSPYFIIKARGGEKIDARSDRYVVNGGPGGCNERYRGHRTEYICRGGEQQFEPLNWFFGETILFDIPEGVEILELGYRESGYDTELAVKFQSDDCRAQKLFEKCVRTLKACMRENFMDCPDRERGQWIGDVSVQAPQAILLLDKNAMLLLRKAICDFIKLRKGERLVGNVPGEHCSELPSQSLNAIGEFGMIAEYYRATGDKEILELAYRPCIEYLKLWQTDGDGMLLLRKGDWQWYDHLFNCDGEVLEHCLYYSALKFANFMADKLSETDEREFISSRLRSIERGFERRYWKNGYYASGGFADERANAMAVLSGLCPSERFNQIRYLLMSVFNCTPYMENYVLSALCEMGFEQDAYRRMMYRYQPLIDSENSTLWEDFFHLGTKNHAWSGGPAVILFRYFNRAK